MTPRGRLVLRSSPDPDGPAQAHISAALGTLGVGPTVHTVWHTPHGTWTVMDQVVPGHRLADIELNPSLLLRLAATLSAMSGHSPAGVGVPTVAGWLHDRLSNDDLPDLPPGQRTAPLHERVDALAILDSLEADAGLQGLCHGDPTFGNVLVGVGGRLKLIDPRGVSGEVTYDLAVVALRAAELGSPWAIAADLADEVGVDPQRVRAWVTVAAAARVVRAVR